MDVETIGVDSDGLTYDMGEGIFGYGTPDGSLGQGPFQAPKVFANRVRQGVFWNPYSYKAYEAAQPEQQWALMKRPGYPRFPGSSGHGTILIGPAMGADDHTPGWSDLPALVGLENVPGWVKLTAIAGAIGLGWYLLR